MIDIHCHILPGVDDGAQTFEDSILMAKEAVSQGIDIIVATPHHHNGRYINEKENIIELVEKLNERLLEERIPITILPGQESRIYGEVLEDYLTNKVLTLNNTHKYILIEFPSNQIPRFTEQLFFDVQANGLTPVIVHPERNSILMKNPHLLYKFVSQGALTQVTAASLVGQFGKKIKKFSFDLIDSNLVHVLASDAHNVSGRNFNMKEAEDIIKSKYGQEVLYFFHENANAMIKGERCFTYPPEEIKRKKILGFL